ncbi:hypothetical protein TSMEX_008972 [Taenia solium]|eukprot:TsM_000984500 transcript=TsM_000984500 gene=TsM_000984500
MSGQLQSESMLCGSVFGLVFLRLAMDTRDYRQILRPPKGVLTQGETTDTAELPTKTSDDGVKYRLSGIKNRQLAWMASGCITDTITMVDAKTDQLE